MILLVDIGNSRIKLACCVSGQVNMLDAIPHQGQALSSQALETLKQLDNKPDRIVVANVAGETHGKVLAEFCQRQWGLTPDVLVTPAAGDGITNGYTEHQQLGIDRWVAMVAAWHRYQGAQCVVDAGSAVTIDVIDGNGMHLGGVIIPGDNLTIQNLTKHSNGINHTAQQGSDQLPVLGRSTRECLLAGGHGTVIDVIERVMTYARSVLKDDEIRCLVTGGTAEELLPSLPEHTRYYPNLVMEGMMIMAGGVA